MALPADVMSTREISAQLDINMVRAQELLRDGLIPGGEKIKGRWHIDRSTASAWLIKNAQRLKALEKEIVAEYWQGYSLPRLQEHDEVKMPRRKIVVPKPHAIAELTIYKNQIGKSQVKARPKAGHLPASEQVVVL